MAGSFPDQVSLGRFGRLKRWHRPHSFWRARGAAILRVRRCLWTAVSHKCDFFWIFLEHLFQNMPRQKQFNKTEVLQKAMELFWKKGFHATSIQDLVLHLGINRASIYDTFGGKEDLFHAALDFYQQQITDYLGGYLRPEVSLKAGFQALFLAALQEGRDKDGAKGCFMVNAICEFLPGSGAMGPYLLANTQRMQAAFEKHLSTHPNTMNGTPPGDASAVAHRLLTFYNGLRVMTKLPFDERQMRATIEKNVAFLATWDGIKSGMD